MYNPKINYNIQWQFKCGVLAALGRAQQLTVNYCGELPKKEVMWERTKLAKCVGKEGRKIVKDVLSTYKEE